MAIKIPVSADTSQVKQGLEGVQDAAESVADSVSDIGKAGKEAATGLNQIVHAARQAEISVQRLARIREILGKEYGRPVSDDEARAFGQNFESMRTNRGLMGGSRIRKYGSFEEWYENNQRDFVNPKDAERYKRNIMNLAGGGTGLPPANNDNNGGGGFFQAAAGRGLAGAKAFAGGMLAIAGITTIMGMAGRAADMATEEAVGTDTLKRRMGDVGVEFEKLRDELRAAGDGLGVASLEAVRLAQHFAKVANSDERTDIAGEIRNAIGFGRSFGVDPNESATFFAQMRQFRVTNIDDPNSRRLAVMIADAIERGQANGKADELIAAVANFTAQATRITLMAPNIEGYLGAMSGLTRTGLAGMTPEMAAQILGAADASVRRGGAMGEASLNFSYAALSRGTPGLGPIQAMMQLESGLFGSAASTFGADSLLGRYGPGGDLSTKTNFELMKEHFQRLGMSEPLTIDALKNHFGLQSYAQAEVLYRMNPQELGGTRSLLDRAGLDPNKISADSLQSLSAISGADDTALRGTLFQQVRGRKDLDERERDRLDRIAATGDTEQLRIEMAKLVAARGQESTDGTMIRDSVVNLNDTLTRIGGGMLDVLSTIRDGVSALVGKIAPESDAANRFRREEELSILKRVVDGHSAEYSAEEQRLQGDYDSAGSNLARQGARARMTRGLQALQDRQQREVERLQYLEEEDRKARERTNMMLQSLDPKASPSSATQNLNISVDGSFELRTPDGARAAEPMQINTRVGAPLPAGQ